MRSVRAGGKALFVTVGTVVSTCEGSVEELADVTGAGEGPATAGVRASVRTVGSWCIELKIRLPRSPQRDLPKALLRLCLQRQLAGMVLQPKLRPLQGRCRKLRKVYTTVQTYYILLTDT